MGSVKEGTTLRKEDKVISDFISDLLRSTIVESNIMNVKNVNIVVVPSYLECLFFSVTEKYEAKLVLDEVMVEQARVVNASQ